MNIESFLNTKEWREIKEALFYKLCVSCFLLSRNGTLIYRFQQDTPICKAIRELDADTILHLFECTPSIKKEDFLKELPTLLSLFKDVAQDYFGEEEERFFGQSIGAAILNDTLYICSDAKLSEELVDEIKKNLSTFSLHIPTECKIIKEGEEKIKICSYIISPLEQGALGIFSEEEHAYTLFDRKVFSLVCATMTQHLLRAQSFASSCLIKYVASCIKKNVRAQDYVARYGGDEFVLLLPETDIKGAKNVAERLRSLIKETPFGQSASFGVAEAKGVERIKDFLCMADKALYKAKEEGRDRVCVWEDGLKSAPSHKFTQIMV